MKKLLAAYTGQPLADNEYLLKIREDGGKYKTGFLSKLTQKGELPVAFKEWGDGYGKRADLQIYVFEEKHRSGWKIVSWRFGQSQNWAKVLTPEGFTLEIYLQQLLEIVLSNTIIDGVIQGELLWQQHKLFKK